MQRQQALIDQLRTLFGDISWVFEFDPREAATLSPVHGPEWFPAWMLLHECGLIRGLVLQPGGRGTDSGRSERGRERGPEYAFGLLTALLTRPAADPKGMEVRRELGSLPPKLLRRHLARLESRPLGRPASSP